MLNASGTMWSVVENRPDRPAAIVSVVNSGERCVQKVIGVQ